MPMYQVKSGCTIEHNNRCYFEGDVVELPSALGAFHEPNISIYVAPVLDDISPKSVYSVVTKEESKGTKETDQEEETTSSIWY